MSRRRSRWHLPLSSSSIHIQPITSLNRNLRALGALAPGNSLAISSAVLLTAGSEGFAFLKLASETWRQQDPELMEPQTAAAGELVCCDSANTTVRRGDRMGLAFKREPLWSAKHLPSLLDFCVNLHKIWTIRCPHAYNYKALAGKAYSLGFF